MARRATFVDSQRAEQGRVLLLDGGDFFNRVHSQRLHESIAAWREMERLGYDAVALGEQELGQWHIVDSLLQLGSTLPLVTTNLERRSGDDWRPVGERYRLLDIAGVRVGILSVLPVGRISTNALEQSQGVLRLLPALETPREVARLHKARTTPGSAHAHLITDRSEIARLARDQADILVLLAYLDQKGMADYADSIPEVDVILGGYRQPADERPARLGHAIVNRSGQRGAVVCVTDLTVTPSNEIVAFGGENVTLDANYPEDPQVAAFAQAAKDASDEERKARLSVLRAKNLERIRQQREERERQRDLENLYPDGMDPDTTGQPSPAGADTLALRPQVRGRY